MSDRPIHFAGSEDTRGICMAGGWAQVTQSRLTSVRTEVTCPDCRELLARTDAAHDKASQKPPTTGTASMLDQCIKIAGKVHKGIGDAAVSAQARGELRANMEVQLDMLRELAKRLGGL